MVRDEDHGALLDPRRDPLRRRVRVVLPLLLPKLTGALDQWAEWLVRGRYAGSSAAEIEELVRALARVRDRVLAAADVRPGDVVLDVGAGTGLLTFGARRLVGETGQVVALDISVDALYELLDAAHAAGAAGVALQLGSAEVIPLPDDSVDVALTRSVLSSVRDTEAAARELFRVVRSGGRVSLFEPLSRRTPSLSAAVDVAELGPLMDERHARRLEGNEPIFEFDAGDLERLFGAAGFVDVAAHVEETVQAASADAVLTAPPAPGRRALLDAWREEHGEESATRLEELVRAAGPRIEQRLTQLSLTARKP